MSTISGPPAAVGRRAAAPGWYPAPRELRWWDGVAWTEHRTAAPAPVVLATPARLPRPRTSGFEVAVSWMATVVTLGYLLPWAVAATRGTRNSPLVAVVNLLLGWTVVGWCAALLMACLGRRSAPRTWQPVAPPLPVRTLQAAPTYAVSRVVPPALAAAPAPLPVPTAAPATLPLPVDLEDTAPLYGLREHRTRD